MAKLLKCYGEDCVAINKKWEKDLLIKYKGKNYCPSCSEKESKEDEDRQLLYNLISELYQIPFPNGLMLRQIKQFKVERKYTYENIRKALLYANYVQKVKFHSKFGLGIVPYVIDEAIVYHEDQVQKAKNMEGKSLTSTKTTIRKNFTNYDRDEKMKEKMINLEEFNL